MMMMKSLFDYIKVVGTSLSIMLNALLGGEPYQTFSARQYELGNSRKFNLVVLIDLFFGIGHCEESYIKWSVAKEAVENIGWSSKS